MPLVGPRNSKYVDAILQGIDAPRAYADTSKKAVAWGGFHIAQARRNREIIEYIFEHGPECADRLEQKFPSKGGYDAPRAVTDMVNAGVLLYRETTTTTRSGKEAHLVALMPWLYTALLKEKGVYKGFPLDMVGPDGDE